MKLRLPSEFLYQVFALLFAVIIVHAAYVGMIRPSADSQLAVQAAQQAAGEAPTGNRSLAIVIKDYEQEACFILMIWALAIMGLKAARTRSEGNMLGRELIAIPEGTSILPRDAREQSRSLEALPLEEQDYLLPRALGNALSRFTTTGSIPAVSDAVREQCDIEADRLDSELSMVRYISWAIPSIGFIGTVRGIGCGARAMRYRSRSARLGALHGALYLLGDSIDWLYWHRARYWRRTGSGLQGR